VLNVTAVIAEGSAPVATSHAIRAMRVVVFPLPAGATHSTGPGAAVAAARWSGASCLRRSATEEGSTGAASEAFLIGGSSARDAHSAGKPPGPPSWTMAHGGDPALSVFRTEHSCDTLRR
jgi:hypothetical protein